MENRLTELLSEEVLTWEEFEEVECHEEVECVEDCGMSGGEIRAHLYIITTNNDDCEVLVK